MSENDEIEELDIPEEDFGSSSIENEEIEPIEYQRSNIQNNSGQSVISRMRERNNRNIQNNTNNIRNAAEIASKSGNPYAMAAGKAVKTADRFSGGKSTEKLGKQLNTANKILPGGRVVQNKLNKTAESGIGTNLFGRRSSNNNYKPKTQSKTLSGTTSKKGAVFAAKNLKIKIILICVLVFVIIILFAAVAVSGGEGGKGGDSSSYNSKNTYLYGNGSKKQLNSYLVDAGYCTDIESCDSSEAAAFYTKLKEKISTNRNLRTQEAEAFITECIFYGRENEDMFNTIDEIEYIASVIGKDGVFTLSTADKYIDSFIADDGYFVTYRSDLVGQDSTLEYRKELFYNILKNANDSYEWMETDINSLWRNYGCTQVTVVGEMAGTYSLDEYVAMVVTAENDWTINGNLENNKAHAIIVRTRVIRETDDCNLSIDNTKGQIKISETASQTAIDATNEVAGQILVDDENYHISTPYDEFCLSSSDENNYYIVQKNIAIPKTWADENKIPSTYLNNVCTEDINNGKGMSIWGARYLSTQGKNYDQILSTFYEDSKLIVVGAHSDGIAISESGFAKRVSRALRDNPYIYNGLGLEGECAWYAVGRTNEILASVGKSTRVTGGGNGGHFCDSNGYGWQYAQFPRVYDVNDFKPGMVISWSSDASIAGHSAGHVAIIEDVYYDSNGNVVSVDISEAALSSGNGIGSTFRLEGYNDLYISTRNVIWNLPSGRYQSLARQFSCEGSLDGSTGNGCQMFVNVQADKIINRWPGYTFNCAMDLLSEQG